MAEVRIVLGLAEEGGDGALTALGIDPDQVTRLVRARGSTAELAGAVTDELGNTHRSWRQVYRGTRVVHGLVTEHARAGAVYAITGALLEDDGSLSALRASPAIADAVRARYAQEGMVEDAAPELVYYEARLAYRQLFTASLGATPGEGLEVYTDAVDGRLLGRGERSPRDWVNVSDFTSCNGDYTQCWTDADLTLTGYALQSEGGVLVTYPAMRRTAYACQGDGCGGWTWCEDVPASTTDFLTNAAARVAVRAFGQSEPLPVAGAPEGAISANRNLARVNAYVAGIGATGFASPAREAVILFACERWGGSCPGASYDDPGRAIRLFYFAGQPVAAAVLDVIAHEYGHGMAYRRVAGGAGFSLTQVIPAALGEGYADAFAAVVEFQEQPDGRRAHPAYWTGQADWLMGEETGINHRDMRDPGNRGHPRHYEEVSPSMTDPHVVAGPHDRAFFLLSEALAARYCSGDIRCGAGMAGRITLQALYYLGPSATYLDSYLAWVHASYDLHRTDPGKAVAIVRAVREAWHDIGFAGSDANVDALVNSLFTQGQADCTKLPRRAGC